MTDPRPDRTGSSPRAHAERLTCDITDERLAELRALADAATSGAWTIEDCSEPGSSGFRIYNEAGDCIAGNFDYEVGGVLERVDAEFIAASRAAVPELLAEVEQMKAERDEAKADAAVLRSRMGQAQRAIHHRMVHRGLADVCEQDLCLMLLAEPPQDTLPEGFDVHLADLAREAVALAGLGYPKGATPFLLALKIMRDKVLAEGGDGSLPLLKPYVEWALRGDHA
jgi:hypothetical protein